MSIVTDVIVLVVTWRKTAGTWKLSREIGDSHLSLSTLLLRDGMCCQQAFNAIADTLLQAHFIFCQSSCLHIIGRTLIRFNSALLLLNVVTLVLDVAPNSSLAGDSSFIQVNQACVHRCTVFADTDWHSEFRAVSSVASSSTFEACTIKTPQANAPMRCRASASPFGPPR